MMDNERATVIAVGGEEYELLLTTKATKEIAGRYGANHASGQSEHSHLQHQTQG